jgi:hypothetical protein
VGVAGLSLAGGIAALRRYETARAEGLDPRAPLVAEVPAPPPSDLLTSASVATAPAASASTASSPLASATPAPERRASPHPPPDTKPRARSSPIHGTPPTEGGCRTVDDAGIWHINPKCL